VVSILPLLTVGSFLINFEEFLQDIVINTGGLYGSFDGGIICWSFKHGASQVCQLELVQPVEINVSASH